MKLYVFSSILCIVSLTVSNLVVSADLRKANKQVSAAIAVAESANEAAKVASDLTESCIALGKRRQSILWMGR